jgi:hypothetical protein
MEVDGLTEGAGSSTKEREEEEEEGYRLLVRILDINQCCESAFH